MARFKIGQKVVAIRALDNSIKKGQIFTIDGFSCCPNCGINTVYLKEVNLLCNSLCDKPVGCGHKEISVRINYNEKNFAPLTSTADAIEYKMKVSIPELIEIKETQLQ